MEHTFMLLSAVLGPGLPESVKVDGGLVSTVLNWVIGQYMAHPFLVPAIAGGGLMAVFFGVRKLFRKGLGLLWRGTKAIVRGVTWPVRKVYNWTFSEIRKSRHPKGFAHGRLPLLNERAYFGPDPIYGLDEQRLVMVTAIYGGAYRGTDLVTGEQVICSPEFVQDAG
jgi:hypothetical protein